MTQGSLSGRQATIVRFTALPSEPDTARLKAAYGLRLDRFVPDLSYLERLDPAAADRVRADFLVRSVAAIPPASKLSPLLPATGPLDLTVILFDDADAAAVTAALTAIGAHAMQVLDDRGIGGQLHVRLTLDDPAGPAQAAAIDDVIWIEPAPVFTDFNVAAAQTNQSGDPARGTIWALPQHITGKDQVIGIIDVASIDMDHGFFAGVAPNRPGPGHRKVLRLFNPNFGGSDHFMQVAGIAAGDALNNPGGHEHRGAAYDAKIVCRSRGDMEGPLNTGGQSLSLQVLLQASSDVGATIHNLSWGTGAGYDTAARNVDAFTLEHEEQLVVAAGEDTGKGTVNQPPGIAFNTILVAAAQAAPNHGFIGSGVPGPTGDGRRKPDLTAVGCGISTAINPKQPPTVLPFYDTGPVPCATSSATPHVSAAAALVRQYFAEGFYPNGKRQPGKELAPTGALVKAVLLNSTVDMDGVPGYPSDAEGWGRIQLDRTLFFEGGTRPLIVWDVPRSAGLRMVETRSFHFNVGNERERLKITFVWTNRPATPQNQPGAPGKPPPKPQVDPIRFEVEDSSGNLYLGNDFDVAKGVSKQAPVSPGIPPDTVNNVQMVVVDQPVGGTWTIRLRPYLHFEKQGFALVVSGGIL